MGKETVVRSAVDQMIVRERSLAEKEQRKPDYFSRVMFDEVSSNSHLENQFSVNQDDDLS